MIGTAINNSITKNWLNSLQVGDVFAYPSNTAPANSLYCAGMAVSRTTYKRLFEKIGTSFGTGDGSTTFNIPDLRGHMIQGIFQSTETVGKKFSAGLPNITGTADVTQGASYSYNATGAFTKTTNGNGGNWDTSSNCKLNLDASRSSSIYGSSQTVQPKAVGFNFYIKY